MCGKTHAFSLLSNNRCWSTITAGPTDKILDRMMTGYLMLGWYTLTDLRMSTALRKLHMSWKSMGVSCLLIVKKTVIICWAFKIGWLTSIRWLWFPPFCSYWSCAGKSRVPRLYSCKCQATRSCRTKRRLPSQTWSSHPEFENTPQPAGQAFLFPRGKCSC